MWATIALSFALAADAAAVSAARALAQARRSEIVILPMIFGGFQAAMAAFGWLGGDAIESRYAGWGRGIASALLIGIGAKMIFDTWLRTAGTSRERKVTLEDANGAALPVATPRESPPANVVMYLGLGIATSIDAAASGPSLPLLGIAPWLALLFIGAITAACSAIGFAIARSLGDRFGDRLGALAGGVLILLGIHVWFQGRSTPPHAAPHRATTGDASNVASRHMPAPTTGPGGASGASNIAPDIHLPKRSGRAPVVTTAPLDVATYEKLQRLTFSGFEVRTRSLDSANGLELRQITADRPRIWATITIAPCQPRALLGDCTALTVAAWQARAAELKAALLHPDIAAAPDTVFEIAATTINDVTWIYQYQFGQTQPASSAQTSATGDARRAGEYAWSHAYVLYYNDGHNQIRVVAEYKDDPAASKEAMAKLVPRTDLENIAKAFADAYTQAW